MLHFARGLSALLCAGMLASGLTTAAPAAEPRQLVPGSAPTTGGDAGVNTSAVRSADRRDDRPNVIMVLTDDMRADELDHMPRTRALLRKQGLEFTDAVSAHPLCCPARAMLLTGQYAQNNGVRHNESKYGGYHRIRTGNTIGTWFSGQGYNTAFIGKHANGYEHDSPRDPGWSIWDPLTGNPTDYFKFRFFGGDRYTGDYVTNRIEQKTNAAIRALAAAEKPFLLFSNHVAPHERQQAGPRGLISPPAEPEHKRYGAGRTSPSVRAKSFNKKVRGGMPRKMKSKPIPRGKIQKKWLARIRSLQSVDEAVASMLKTLEDTGTADNTYIVFTSDNGYSLGERRLQKKNTLASESLQIPMVVTGPTVKPGKSKLPVTLTDLVATMADLAEVKPRLKIDGVSFRRTLRGGLQPWRDTTLIQTGFKHNPRKHKRLKHKGWALRGVRTDRYTYARDVNTGERLLFDRRADRWELSNRASQRRYARVVAELDKRTRRLVNCKGSACNRTFGKVPSPR